MLLLQGPEFDKDSEMFSISINIIYDSHVLHYHNEISHLIRIKALKIIILEGLAVSASIPKN